VKRLILWARWLKRDVMTLWFAFKHVGAPWYTRLLTVLLAIYVVSPVDLMPDFIPLVGYLDDMVIVPAGVWVLLRLIPGPVLIDCQEQADKRIVEQEAAPRSIGSVVIVVALWIVLIWAIYKLFIA